MRSKEKGLEKPQALCLRLFSFRLEGMERTQGETAGLMPAEASVSASGWLKLKLRRGEPGGFFREMDVLARLKLKDRRGEPGGFTRGGSKVRLTTILLLTFFSLTSVAFAQLSGTVTNGTKGKPAAGMEVQLVILGQGMEVAGKTTTDAQGRFSFTADPSKPMMVRATYQGINYHEVHSPGQSSVDLKVYETASEGRFNVDEMVYIVQQSQDQLLVGRQYVVSNKTTPPVTLNRTNGVFTFTLPDGTKPERVSAVGSNNMPLPVAARPAGENSWTIEYPLRPGETRFFLVTQFPYQDRKAALRESLPWQAEQVKLYVPPQMKVEAPGFQSTGTEQGLAAYTLASAKAGAEITWTVSGEAPPMTGSEEGGETSNEATSRVQIVPGPVNENRWIIIGILAGLFVISGMVAVRRSASARRASEGG